MSQSAIAQWLSGNVKSLRAETAAALETATGFKARWIITGKGEERLGEADKLQPTLRAVAQLFWSQAGVVRTHAEMRDTAVEDWVSCPVPHGPDAFALRVRGSSMHNPSGPLSFAEGDWIYADPDRTPRHGSLVIVRDNDEAEARFRQLLIEGKHFYLQALNPAWPERITEASANTDICGVVIGRLTTFE